MKFSASCTRARASVPAAEIETCAGDCVEEGAVVEGLTRAHAMAGRLDIAFATVGGGAFKPLMMLEAQELRADLESTTVLVLPHCSILEVASVLDPLRAATRQP